MLELKTELIHKLTQKGMDVRALAQAIEFDPELLKLYLAKDEYPIPTRIIKKIEEVLAN